MQLEIKNVSKKYGDFFALENVCASLNNGIYGLIGPNGAGKTTLINIILGLIEADNGVVIADNKPIKDYGDEFYKKVGYLPQYPRFYKNFTGKEFLDYMCCIKGLKKKDVCELLHTVNLWEDMNKKIGAYSGGMRQRLGIAQAMLNDPELLILDEPTAGLDPAERIRFRNIISRLSADRIIILATHIISDIEAIAKEVILLNGGKIVVSRTPDELINEIQNYVWEITTDKENVDEFENKYLVSNLQVNNNEYSVKFISKERPDANCKGSRATLDDVFLWYFGGQT